MAPVGARYAIFAANLRKFCETNKPRRAFSIEKGVSWFFLRVEMRKVVQKLGGLKKNSQFCSGKVYFSRKTHNTAPLLVRGLLPITTESYSP